MVVDTTQYSGNMVEILTVDWPFQYNRNINNSIMKTKRIKDPRKKIIILI